MKYELNDEIRGLLRAALGESLSGFAAERFPSDYKSHAGRLLRQIDDESVDYLSGGDLVFAAKALEFALRELGVEDFFTDTGFDFDFGIQTLHHLQAAMAKSTTELED